MINFRFGIALLGASLYLISNSVSAQNYYDWDGGAGSSAWWTASNWAPDTAITAINNDANAVLRFDGSPAATPGSMGLPGNSQIVVQQIWFAPGFNPSETTEIVLGGAGVADLQLRGANPRFQVDHGLVSTVQSTGSEIRLNGDATFDIGGELRVQGAIINNSVAAPASLLKTGTGTLVLRGNNSFGGTGRSLRLVAGVVDVASDANLGHSTNTLVFAGDVQPAAVLRVNAQGGNLQINRAISVDTVGGYSFDIQNTDATGVTISDDLDYGNFANPPLLRKSGNGTLRLTGHAGMSRVLVSAGRLMQAADQAFTAWPGVVIEFPATSTGVISLAGHDTEVAALVGSDGNAGVIENGSAQDMTLSITGMFDERYGGSLRDGGAGKLGLRVAGSFGSTQTLAGNNSFSGDVEVQGKLHLANAAALGSTSAPTRVQSGGTLSMTNLQLAEPLILNGGRVRNVSAPSSTLNGLVQLTADSRLAGDGNSLNLAAPIYLGTHALRTEGHVVLNAPSVTFASAASVSVDSGLLELHRPQHWHDANLAVPLSVASGSSLLVHHDTSLSLFPNNLQLVGPGNGDASLRFSEEDDAASTLTLSGELNLQSMVCLAASANTHLRLTGAILGTGGLCKQGSNILTIASNPSLLGEFRVENGELRLEAALPTGSVSTVLGSGCCTQRTPSGTPQALLSGTGTAGNVVLDGGALVPGSGGVGTLSALNVQVSELGGELRMQLGDDALNPERSDRLLINQLTLAAGAQIGLAFADGMGMVQPGRFRLLETVQTHSLTAADFVVLSYTGSNGDFAGRVVTGAHFVDFEMTPMPLFANGFE